MKAEITLEQVWNNPSVMHFFFRQQAIDQLTELIEKTADDLTALDIIEDYANDNKMDLDCIEEMLYEESLETLVEEFGLELIEDTETEDYNN